MLRSVAPFPGLVDIFHFAQLDLSIAGFLYLLGIVDDLFSLDFSLLASHVRGQDRHSVYVKCAIAFGAVVAASVLAVAVVREVKAPVGSDVEGLRTTGSDLSSAGEGDEDLLANFVVSHCSYTDDGGDGDGRTAALCYLPYVAAAVAWKKALVLGDDAVVVVKMTVVEQQEVASFLEGKY